jgi:hypothetical protein
VPSVVFVTLGKDPFAECQKKTLGKETLCRVSKIKHSAKSFFAECFILPRVFCVALGKELLCRVPEIKHSAKNMALGKEQNSGSVSILSGSLCHQISPYWTTSRSDRRARIMTRHVLVQNFGIITTLFALHHFRCAN